MSNKRPIEILSADEVEVVISTFNPKCPTGARNIAIIRVLYGCQLRSAECCDLHVRDYDGETLLVRHGKGDKRREVGVPHETREAIASWMSYRGENYVGSDYLFPTLTGGRVSTNYLRNAIVRARKKSGLKKRVHLHGFRHSGASRLLDKGAKLQDIQRQLGHSSIATTDKYLHSINDKARCLRISDSF